MQNVQADESVTVVFTHVVKPGCEADYEQWAKGISKAAAGFEGYAGISVLRPNPKERAEHVSILRFNHYDHLEAWMNSDVRQQWLEQASTLTTHSTPHTQMLTGLETWFVLPGQPMKPPPPRYKIAILTWVSVYGLLMLLGFTLAPLLSALPAFVRTLIISVIMVVLITYAVMPQLTKLTAKWLYKAKDN
ncbi:MAG: antibiotic biosynthesis monooxygenase [Phormidesmis sp.]